MIIMKIFHIILLVFLPTLTVSSQPLAERFISEFDQGLPKTMFEDEEGGVSAIKTLEKLATNENKRVRSYAHFRIKEIGIRNNAIGVKTNAVASILKFSFDSDVAIRRNNASFYTAFPKEAFPNDIIPEIKSILHDDRYVNRGHVLLVGFLGLSEEKAYLENHIVGLRGNFLSDYSQNEINKLDFAAHLALARMGETEHVDYVIRKIMAMPEGDILRKRIETLSFIKHPKAVEIMFDYLLMDKQMQDATGEERPYANYVIPYIYKSVKEFPIKKDGWFGYSEEEIAEARNWVKAHRNDYKINSKLW
jgi:hypothetical protein